MTNPTTNDSINTRIAVLEVIVIDLKKDRDRHGNILETMSENNHKMALALDRISTQLSTGIKGIGIGFVLMTTLVSAGWVYQQNIDEKMAGNTQTLSAGLDKAAQTLVTHDQRLIKGSRDAEEKGEDNSDRIDRVENNKVDKAKRYLK